MIRKSWKKRKKKKKAAAEKNTNLPTTKIVIPPNLQEDNVKTRKTYIQKKNVMANLNPVQEKERIDEFLDLLDITDK